MSLIFSEDARDRSQAPVLVRFMELGRLDACVVQLLAKRFELRFVLDREVNVRRMVVSRSSICVGVFNGCVAGLNCLLREWEVSTRDGIEIMFLLFDNLELSHDASFRLVDYKIGLEDRNRTYYANPAAIPWRSRVFSVSESRGSPRRSPIELPRVKNTNLPKHDQ